MSSILDSGPRRILMNLDSSSSLFNHMKKEVVFCILPYLGNVGVLEARQMREENPGDVQQNENIQLQWTRASSFSSKWSDPLTLCNSALLNLIK